MRQFEFPLQSVLRLRRFTEAQARQALMEAVARLRQAEDDLAATRRQIAYQTSLLTDQLAQLTAMEVVIAWRQLELLENLALKQAAQVADAETVVAQKQRAYQEAQRERKPLERLEEEMRRVHYQKADLAEQAVVDELAILSHSRRGNSP